MERKTRGIKSRDDQGKISKEGELALHKIFGQVAMSINPKAVVSRLIRNAANDVPLTPEWEAFRDGALEVAYKSSPKETPTLSQREIAINTHLADLATGIDNHPEPLKQTPPLVNKEQHRAEHPYEL